MCGTFRHPERRKTSRVKETLIQSKNQSSYSAREIGAWSNAERCIQAATGTRSTSLPARAALTRSSLFIKGLLSV